MNYFDWALAAIRDMLTANSGVFVSLGQNMFRGLATIMIAWFGIKTALSAGEHVGGFHFSRFASLILMVSFGFAMVTYYDAPIPGFGVSFHELIWNQASFLSTTISGNELNVINNRISAYEGTVESPSSIEFWAYFDYFAIILLLSLAQAVAMVVVIYGLIAGAVCVLVGPLFIPFFIVPQLDWLFWGWFKAFMQYAFYQVIAAAVVFIVGQALTGFMQLRNGQPIPITQQGALLPALFIVVVGTVYALLQVPQLTSHIFGGMSGGSAGILSSLSR